MPVSTETNNPRGSTTLLFAVGSFLAFIAMMVSSLFRHEMFGVESGNAGHKFGLGFIYIVMSVPILGFSIWAFVSSLIRWNRLNTLNRYGTMIPSVLILVTYAYLLTRLLT